MGRTVRWTKEGLESEGDDKLRKVLIEEWGMESSSGATTPGVREEKEKVGIEIEITDKKRVAKFRRGAAQAKYLALDNPKIGSASKEISRGMAKPTEDDERKLKRLVMYLEHEKGSGTTTHCKTSPVQSVAMPIQIGPDALKRADHPAVAL